MRYASRFICGPASGSNGSGTVQAIVSSAVVGIPMAFVGSGSPIQWDRGGVPIPGATSATYTPVSGDVQSVLGVTVNGTRVTTTQNGNTCIVAPASAVFATALAAVSNGQYFTAPSAANSGARLRIYLKTAGEGVLYDVTAASGVVNSAWAAVLALAKPSVTPVMDFDSASAFYGEREFQNLAAGAGARTLNLLAPHGHAKTGYRVQGTPTITGRVADSQGGTLGTQITIASGAAASTDMYLPTRVPPGRWTLSFDGIAITTGLGAATQAIKFNAGGTNTTANLTTSWQTFSFTFNNTTEAALNMLWAHGDYPGSAASVNYDFVISNLRLVPGSVAGGNVNTDSHPAVYTSTDVAYSTGNNGLELESLTADASSGNMLTAKLATLTNLTAWTFESTLKAPASTATTNTPILAMLAKSDMTGNGTILGQYASYAGPPAYAGTYTKVGGSAVRDTVFNGFGRIVYTLVVHGGGNSVPSAGTPTGVDVYMNGLFIQNVDGSAVNAGAQSSTAAVFFNSLASITSSLSGSTQYSLIADMSGGKFFNSDLTTPQAANSAAGAIARATAKGLTIAPITTVVMPTGDSIDYGLGDGGAPYGYVNKALSSLANGAGNAIPVAMQAKSGEALDAYVTRMNATVAGNGYMGGLAQCAQFIAAGVRVIVTVKIGTNNDANLTSQANVEAFYNANYLGNGNSLKAVYAAWRAAGAKVVACTHIPDNRGYVFESGAGAVSGTPGTGTGTIAATTVSNAAGLNGQTFAGWRAYLNALIKSDQTLYDALCDFAAESHFAGIYPNCNGGNPLGIYSDTLHPKDLGNAYLAVTYKAAISPLVV